jgi:cytochrome c oxidase cbb3-type subunit 3
MATPDKTPPQDHLLDHSYDGIREYDNPMPRWWLLTFAGTIIFSIIYLFNVGPVGNGEGRIADYDADVARFAALHPQPTAADAPVDRLLALSGNQAALADGKQVYATNCAVCHRPDGGGLIGPNLADANWIHGGAVSDIYRTVVSGVLDKGMPPWGKTLKPEQVEAVVAYVASLKGSNPPNPKAPQGELVKP